MSQNLPESIGRYRILRLLGSGAMGDVYLAEDPNIGRELAIKTVRVVGGSPDDVADRKQRLLREAKAAGKFVHPNVVTLFDADEADGTLYLAFEYVPPGVDLAQRMIQGTKGGPAVTLRQALRWVREIAQALQFAHDSGIVHRDIKPSNVLIAEDGTAKVADFGIAKLLGPGTELTRTGSVVGSPQYMSPEQVRGEELDGRSDVFSLGVVFYELLCGIRPFGGDTLSTLVFEILSKEPPPVGSLRPSLPGDLVTQAHRMLAKDRDHRSASATKVVEAIRGLEASTPAHVLDAPAAPSDVEKTRRMATEISAQIDAQAANASQGPESPTVQSQQAQPPIPPTPPPTPVSADPTLVASQAAASPPPTGPPPVPVSEAARSPEMSTSLPSRAGSGEAGTNQGSNTARNVILGLGVLGFLGLIVLVGGWFVVKSMAPGLLPSSLGGSETEVAETTDESDESDGSDDPLSEEDAAGEETTDEATESSTEDQEGVEDEASEDAAALEDLRNEVAEADLEPPPQTEPQPAPPPTPVTTAPPPPAPPPPTVETRPPPPPVQPAPQPAEEAQPEPAPEPAVDEELERWQDAASQVNREMSTGLHFRFDIKPKDLYVIVRVWPKGQDMIVKGGADTFKDGRKGQDMTLPGSGDHLLQLLVNGEVQHAILVHASATSTQTTTITLDFR